MTFVLDSGLLIDHLRRHEGATTVMAGALRSERRVTASVLSRIELWRGARPEQTEGMIALDGLVDWVPVDHQIAAIAADYAERLGPSHAAISTVDYVIAATTSRLGADLLTSNVSHFPMFPDLQAPY